MKAVLLMGGVARGSLGAMTAVPSPSGQMFRARIGSYQQSGSRSRAAQRNIGMAANAWSKTDYDIQTQWSNYQAEAQALLNESGPTIKSGYPAFVSVNSLVLGSGGTAPMLTPPKVAAPDPAPSYLSGAAVVNADGSIFMEFQFQWTSSIYLEDTYAIVYISKSSSPVAEVSKAPMTLLGTINANGGPLPTQIYAPGTVPYGAAYNNGEFVQLRVLSIRGGRIQTTANLVAPVPAH
jgi:hypothetical protein